VYPGNYEDYRWRKEGGAATLNTVVSETVSAMAPGTAKAPVNGKNAAVPAADSGDGKGKRLNPIKRKQMEDRIGELEQKIGEAEDAIARYETAQQTFVSAEETQRITHELAEARAGLQKLLSEWEELSGVLEEGK
jgi:ATP-binding cassette subfamily F protein 3